MTAAATFARLEAGGARDEEEELDEDEVVDELEEEEADRELGEDALLTGEEELTVDCFLGGEFELDAASGLAEGEAGAPFTAAGDAVFFFFRASAARIRSVAASPRLEMRLAFGFWA